MEKGTMTRKEMLTKCVEDQVNRGILKPEDVEAQVNARLTGAGGMKRMSWSACNRWYRLVFGE